VGLASLPETLRQAILDQFPVASDQPDDKLLTLPLHEIAQWTERAKAGLAQVDAERAAIVAAVSERAFIRLRHCALAIAQAIEVSGTGQTNAYRDQAMADNVRWLANTAHPGEKIILWAHNAHVAATPGMMGGHLRAALGNSLVIIGLASHHGTVRARPMSAGAFDPAVSPTGIALAQPRPDSLDDMLNQVGKPYFALDLRKARAAGGALAAWLDEPRWETCNSIHPVQWYWPSWES
jgi:erythromycin esterase